MASTIILIWLTVGLVYNLWILAEPSFFDDIESIKLHHHIRNGMPYWLMNLCFVGLVAFFTVCWPLLLFWSFKRVWKNG